MGGGLGQAAQLGLPARGVRTRGPGFAGASLLPHARSAPAGRAFGPGPRSRPFRRGCRAGPGRGRGTRPGRWRWCGGGLVAARSGPRRAERRPVVGCEGTRGVRAGRSAPEAGSVVPFRTVRPARRPVVLRKRPGTGREAPFARSRPPSRFKLFLGTQQTGSCDRFPGARPPSPSASRTGRPLVRDAGCASCPEAKGTAAGSHRRKRRGQVSQCPAPVIPVRATARDRDPYARRSRRLASVHGHRLPPE